MAGINKVILRGNVVGSPYMFNDRYNAVQMDIGVVGSAKRDGKFVEVENVFIVVVYGDLATAVMDAVKEGDEVLIDGKLRIVEWRDQYGDIKTRTDVVAHSINNLTGKQLQVIKYQPKPFVHPTQPPHQVRDKEAVPSYNPTKRSYNWDLE